MQIHDIWLFFELRRKMCSFIFLFCVTLTVPCVVVQLWMQIFQHIITAMMFFQIIMIALFGIKKSPGPAILTAPLPFLTIVFLLYNLNLFNRPQVIISNRTAADIDKRQSQVPCTT